MVAVASVSLLAGCALGGPECPPTTVIQSVVGADEQFVVNMTDEEARRIPSFISDLLPQARATGYAAAEMYDPAMDRLLQDAGRGRGIASPGFRVPGDPTVYAYSISQC